VSFRTYMSGADFITVRVAQELEEARDALRVIQVPFRVPQSGVVEIASITDGQLVHLPPGAYA